MQSTGSITKKPADKGAWECSLWGLASQDRAGQRKKDYGFDGGKWRITTRFSRTQSLPRPSFNYDSNNNNKANEWHFLRPHVLHIDFVLKSSCNVHNYP